MKVRKIFACLIMAVALLVSASEVATLHVYAEELEGVEVIKAKLVEMPEAELHKNTRTMMTQCIISVSCSAAGMQIDMSTGTVGTASVLGIKDVKIMKKVWYGWKTVAVSDGGEAYGTNIMGVSLLYANAEYDETYRITCVHYADVDGYIEGENDTGSIVFTY